MKRVFQDTTSSNQRLGHKKGIFEEPKTFCSSPQLCMIFTLPQNHCQGTINDLIFIWHLILCVCTFSVSVVMCLICIECPHQAATVIFDDSTRDYHPHIIRDPDMRVSKEEGVRENRVRVLIKDKIAGSIIYVSGRHMHLLPPSLPPPLCPSPQSC